MQPRKMKFKFVQINMKQVSYTRRHDLELRGVESIWIELTLKHKHILFEVFYRPPYSEAVVFSAIEDSIDQPGS